MTRRRKAQTQTVTIPGNPGVWIVTALIGWLIYIGQLSQIISRIEDIVCHLVGN